MSLRRVFLLKEINSIKTVKTIQLKIGLLEVTCFHLFSLGFACFGIMCIYFRLGGTIYNGRLNAGPTS